MSEQAQPTPGPWAWIVHDHSMASLGPGEFPGLGDPLVLAIGPCKACTKRAEEAGEDWKWGRCHTPSVEDAALIATAPEIAAERDRLRVVNAELLEALDVAHRALGRMPAVGERYAGTHADLHLRAKVWISKAIEAAEDMGK